MMWIVPRHQFLFDSSFHLQKFLKTYNLFGFYQICDCDYNLMFSVFGNSLSSISCT